MKKPKKKPIPAWIQLELTLGARALKEAQCPRCQEPLWYEIQTGSGDPETVTVIFLEDLNFGMRKCSHCLKQFHVHELKFSFYYYNHRTKRFRRIDDIYQ